MNHNILSQVSRLRALLEEMEKDLGLVDLSRNERDIILAFFESTRDEPEEDRKCTTETVRANPIVRKLSQPTFHRALKQLVSRGLIEKCEGMPMGIYRLTPKATELV